MSSSLKSAGERVAPSIPATPPSPAPLPLRDGSVTLRDLVDLYMLHYAGRDGARAHRLAWWQAQLGPHPFTEISDDHIHAALEGLAHREARYYAGKDADGVPIYKGKGRPMLPATINRYHQALAAVLTWAIKRRIAPKGWMNPSRAVEKRSEAGSARTRFLSDAERERLLLACKAAAWDKLYLLVLMALTTGARKGELQGLRWADIDLEARLAHVGRSKNGDPKALPLVPAVSGELVGLKGAPTTLVFGSKRVPGTPFEFIYQWHDALKAAGIRGFRFHDLRHSCASHLAANGATLLEIADVLGHRQLQMTKRYSHLTTAHKAGLIDRLMGTIR